MRGGKKRLIIQGIRREGEKVRTRFRSFRKEKN